MMTDTLINGRFSLERKYDDMAENMRRTDAKYEEMPCRAA
jgi:hypothetical protein